MTSPTRKRLPRRLYSRAIGILSHGGYDLCEIVEISEGGMMVRAVNQVYPDKTAALLNFYLPNGGMMIIQADVCWVKKVNELPGTFVGFQFRKVTFQYRRLIRAYVAEKHPDEVNLEKYKMSAPDQAILDTKLDKRAIRREAVRK